MHVLQNSKNDLIESDAIGLEKYSSELNTIMKRRYEKLFEVLILLGGIASDLILLFELVQKRREGQLIQPPKVIRTSPKEKKLHNHFQLSIWEKI